MKSILQILFFCLSVSVLYSQTANGDMDSLTTDEIIVTANRINTSQMLAPNNVHVIDKELLLHLNSNCLSDALTNSAGVYIRDYGFGSGLKTISLNSTQTEHTLLLLNGIRLNSTQNAQYDLNLIMTDLIERIEVSKGGSSSLYGSEAVGGVINLITFDNFKNSFYELKTEIASFNTKRLFLRAYRKFSFNDKVKLDVDVSFSGQNSDNDYEYKYFNGFSEETLRRVNAQYKNTLFNITSFLSTDIKTRYSFFINYSFWDRNIPGVMGTGFDAKAKQADNDIISLIGLSRILSSVVSLTGSFSYKYSLMKYNDPVTVITQNPVNSFYKQHSITASSDFKIKKDGFESNFGTEYSFSNLLSNETDYAARHQIGLYSASKLSLFKAIIIYPSIRYDYYSDVAKHVITGKLGFNIKPFSNTDLSLKATAGNNFRAPTFNELFWKDLGNKNLNPEKSLSFDCGIFFKHNTLAELVTEISYYHTLTNDRIIWQPDTTGLWRPGNIGEVKSQGIDFSFSVKKIISKFISVKGGFNYNYSSAIKNNLSFRGDPSYSKQLIYTPKEFAKANLSLEVYPQKVFIKEISFNAYYNFTGKRYIDPENLKFVEYYETFDGNVNLLIKLLNFETGLKFSVNNLFNKNYEIIPGYPMALRNYRVQLSIKY